MFACGPCRAIQLQIPSLTRPTSSILHMLWCSGGSHYRTAQGGQHVAQNGIAWQRSAFFFWFKAERDWDVVEEKPTGPCMTCAWERMRARKLELQREVKKYLERWLIQKQTSQNPSNASQDPELVKMKDIAKVLAEALPELQKKAFSQFLVAITKELRIPKLLIDDTQ